MAEELEKRFKTLPSKHFKTRVQKKSLREEIQNSLKDANKRATRQQSQGEASNNATAPPKTVPENTSIMRERLVQISQKLETIPKGRETKGIVITDSIIWTIEESKTDSLPPYPKYQGYKGLWSIEKAKLDVSTIPKERAHELRKQMGRIVEEELNTRCDSTESFIRMLRRLSLQAEKTVLIEIYAWRDTSRVAEFESIKFTMPTKRNDRLNVLQYHLKARGREFTRAVDALSDAIETSMDKEWDRNQNSFINALETVLKRLWWISHVLRSVSKNSPLQKLKF